VRCGGLWQAEALDGSPLEPGWTVVVRNIEGLKLIVDAQLPNHPGVNAGDEGSNVVLFKLCLPVCKESSRVAKWPENRQLAEKRG